MDTSTFQASGAYTRTKVVDGTWDPRWGQEDPICSIFLYTSRGKPMSSPDSGGSPLVEGRRGRLHREGWVGKIVFV